MDSGTRDLASHPDAEWTLGRSFKPTSVALPKTEFYMFNI